MIMVKYQGQIESLNLVEEFEDHVMQTAAAPGSRAHLWRSSTKYSPGRLVRGLSLHLCPGQEAVSLLLSPEGLLIPEQAADEAIFAPLLQQPWCHVRTHCGGVDRQTRREQNSNNCRSTSRNQVPDWVNVLSDLGFLL